MLVLLYLVLVILFSANLAIVIFLFFSILRAVIFLINKKCLPAPFVPIKNKALSRLLEKIEINDNSVVYDLGCGNGKILKALAKKFPQSDFIGIEFDLFPYLLAKISTRKTRNIKILFGDFLQKNISDADIVVAYLFPELMNKLAVKAQKELKPNSKFYSFDFEFSDRVPEKVFATDSKMGAKIYKYKF